MANANPVTQALGDLDFLLSCGLTPAAIAERVGATSRTVRRWRRRATTPTSQAHHRALRSAAQALQTT